jgi:hypothetical protein
MNKIIRGIVALLGLLFIMMIQGAAFALPQILIELVLATLLLFAASRLPSENI